MDSKKGVIKIVIAFIGLIAFVAAALAYDNSGNLYYPAGNYIQPATGFYQSGAYNPQTGVVVSPPMPAGYYPNIDSLYNYNFPSSTTLPALVQGYDPNGVPIYPYWIHWKSGSKQIEVVYGSSLGSGLHYRKPVYGNSHGTYN